MELGDSEVPNQFDDSGMINSEANVSRSELQAHNARMEQEKRDAAYREAAGGAAALL